MNLRATVCLPQIAFAAAAFLFAGGHAGAAVYGQQGVRAKVISVCFVGDAVTNRPARVQQIESYLTDYGYAANILFDFQGQCAAATTQSNGNAYYAGDIRVVIPGTRAPFTGLVPGKGCPMFLDSSGKYTGANDGGGSWSNFPNDLSVNRSCMYNLKLNDDGDAHGIPWRNHTLHEFGHALGLSHEHERTDADKKICSAPGFGGSTSSGFLTPYDRYSLMHYQFTACGINGNYDNTGLSEMDRLGVHILYPEEGFVAEHVGTTVVDSAHPVLLRSAWGVRGANLSYVASGFRWVVNGSLLSTTSELKTWLPTGVNPFLFTHRDFLGRTYTYQGIILVLPIGQYEELMASLNTQAIPLL